MTKLCLVNPWDYHTIGRKDIDPSTAWHSGPYNLLLLATVLKRAGHDVRMVDMYRDVVVARGSKDVAIQNLIDTVTRFKPDIVGFTLFSIHYLDVRETIRALRAACARISGYQPTIIAGGIHPTIEPLSSLDELDVDYVFIGESEISLLKFADGLDPWSIPGVLARGAGQQATQGEQVKDLDTLPWPEWSLCDYAFYAHPTTAHAQVRVTSNLDVLFGRGCVYRCGFCAYPALSQVRFHSAEYMVEQIRAMHSNYGVTSTKFIDSTLGNNRKRLTEFCELMLKTGTHKQVLWLTSLRANQATPDLLRLMQRAGCFLVLYGIESNSQRVLNLMNKGVKVGDNERTTEIHNLIRLPYISAMILGYPGEQVDDIERSIDYMWRHKPPSIGFNCYVPLPGSPDYDQLRERGVIKSDDPMEWRRLGEINGTRVYADIEENTFKNLVIKTGEDIQRINVILGDGWKNTPSSLDEDGPLDATAGINAYFLQCRDHGPDIRPVEGKSLPIKDWVTLADLDLGDWWDKASQAIGEDGSPPGDNFPYQWGIIPGSRIIDIGCGFGFRGVRLAELGAKVTFVDINAAAIGLVRRICRLKGVEDACSFLVLTDVLDLCRLELDYDAILAGACLARMPPIIAKPEFDALAARLREGGRFIMRAEPLDRTRTGKVPKCYDAKGMIDLLRPTRFKETPLQADACDDSTWIDLTRADRDPDMVPPMARRLEGRVRLDLASCERYRPVGASITREGRFLRVLTPPQRWSYALEIPLALTDEDRQPGGRFYLGLRARVLKGEIGVGLLRESEREFLFELRFSPNSDSAQMMTAFPSLEDTKVLIIRNVSRDNEISEMVIESVDIFRE